MHVSQDLMWREILKTFLDYYSSWKDVQFVRLTADMRCMVKDFFFSNKDDMHVVKVVSRLEHFSPTSSEMCCRHGISSTAPSKCLSIYLPSLSCIWKKNHTSQSAFLFQSAATEWHCAPERTYGSQVPSSKVASCLIFAVFNSTSMAILNDQDRFLRDRLMHQLAKF